MLRAVEFQRLKRILGAFSSKATRLALLVILLSESAL
jgi:hypothetical protein